MDFNEQELDRFMNEGKWTEAKALLDGYLNQLPESEMRGAAHVRFASLYLKVMKELNTEYIATLDDAIDTMKKLAIKEKDLTDQKGIEEARDKLKSI